MVLFYPPRKSRQEKNELYNLLFLIDFIKLGEGRFINYAPFSPFPIPRF